MSPFFLYVKSRRISRWKKRADLTLQGWTVTRSLFSRGPVRSLNFRQLPSFLLSASRRHIPGLRSKLIPLEYREKKKRRSREEEEEEAEEKKRRKKRENRKTDSPLFSAPLIRSTMDPGYHNSSAPIILFPSSSSRFFRSRGMPMEHYYWDVLLIGLFWECDFGAWKRLVNKIFLINCEKRPTSGSIGWYIVIDLDKTVGVRFIVWLKIVPGPSCN